MRVGIIGCGTLGSGIAVVFASSKEHEVFLCGRNKESANRGKQRIRAMLDRRVQKGKLSNDDFNSILSRVNISELPELSECDLIIEAVPEDLEIKQTLFKTLDSICKASCIFASNTSSLSIETMSHDLGRKIIGIHFFNPAEKMKLVEVVKYDETQNDTVDRICKILQSLGKVVVVVKDSTGFVVNRLMIPYINDAIDLLYHGIANKEDIDIAMKFGANYPMGPLELADYIGLDIILAIMNSLKNDLSDTKYIPSQLLIEMVDNGKLGVKTGEGFYRY